MFSWVVHVIHMDVRTQAIFCIVTTIHECIPLLHVLRVLLLTGIHIQRVYSKRCFLRLVNQIQIRVHQKQEILISISHLGTEMGCNELL